MTYFISRHPGAREWARSQGLAVDQFADHLDPGPLLPGDAVIGNLPVHLAAAVCARGARYLHLKMEVPAAWRGAELTAEQMRACGAAVRQFWITERRE